MEMHYNRLVDLEKANNLNIIVQSKEHSVLIARCLNTNKIKTIKYKLDNHKYDILEQLQYDNSNEAIQNYFKLSNIY